MEINSRKMILQAYDIEYDVLKDNRSDLYEVLCRRLSGETYASDRRLKLTSSTEQEDVLTDFNLSESGVFGVMMRIAPSEGIATIPDTVFNEKTIRLEGITRDEEPTVTVLQTFYFFAGKNFVISTLPPSQIKRLQVYFNFLLSFEGIERNYKFYPSIKVPVGIRLNEMKQFIIGDQCHLPTSIGGEATPKTRILDLAGNMLNTLTCVVPDINEMIKNKILNARLVISFSKPRKMTEADYKRILSSYIKPIADIDDVKFKLKNQKTFKGKEVLRTKEINVECLDRIRINEMNLCYDMKEFIKELES